MRKTTIAAAMLAVAGHLGAQEPPAAPPEPATGEGAKSTTPLRPIEGNVIINLPSVEAPREGTLTLFFTHRFQQAVQDSNVHSLFSFDSSASIGIGLGYAPVKNFDVSFYRSSFNKLGIYEIAGKYHLFKAGPLHLALRVGDDLRTAEGLANRSSFFAQAIASLQLGPRVRITAVPTYMTKTTGQTGYFVKAADGTLTIISPEPVYRDIFNVPVAATIALTRSITIHGEVVPNYRRTVEVNQICQDPVCPSFSEKSSPGIGWNVSIEKTVLRHRFCFTAGNLQETTVDQYLVSNFLGRPRDIHLGFNIVRQWKLK